MTDLLRKGALAAVRAELEQLRHLRDQVEVLMHRLVIEPTSCACDQKQKEEEQKLGLDYGAVRRYYVPNYDAAMNHMHEVLGPMVKLSRRLELRTEHGPYVGKGSALDSKSPPKYHSSGPGEEQS